MSTDALEELRTFLRDHVSSFEELEVLLFFARAPDQVRTAADVMASLNLSEDLARGALEALMAGGQMLERVGGSGRAAAYRYAPSREVAPLLAKLQLAYAEQRLNIVQIMSSNAVERVRSSAARRLADAFRLDRRKK